MNKTPTTDSIDYTKILEGAMRNALRDILKKTATEGLPGEHYFYITFATTHPKVDIPNYLHQTYPEEMTIILQHQFWDLKITDDYFHVALNFNRKKESLTIPFAALIIFADPSVNFSLNFNHNTPRQENIPTDKLTFITEPPENKQTKMPLPKTKMPLPNKAKNTKNKQLNKNKKEAKIIIIDQFRKK